MNHPVFGLDQIMVGGICRAPRLKSPRLARKALDPRIGLAPEESRRSICKRCFKAMPALVGWFQGTMQSTRNSRAAFANQTQLTLLGRMDRCIDENSISSQ